MELQESKKNLAGVLLSPHDGGRMDDSLGTLQVSDLYVTLVKIVASDAPVAVACIALVTNLWRALIKIVNMLPPRTHRELELIA